MLSLFTFIIIIITASFNVCDCLGKVHAATILAIVLVSISLFAVGAVKTYATRGNWLYGGTENLVMCGIGAPISYGIGYAYSGKNSKSPFFNSIAYGLAHCPLLLIIIKYVNPFGRFGYLWQNTGWHFKRPLIKSDPLQIGALAHHDY